MNMNTIQFKNYEYEYEYKHQYSASTIRTVFKYRNSNTKLFAHLWSRQSRNCPPNPETVRTIQKLSGQSKNSPDNPETVLIIQKLNFCNQLITLNSSTFYVIFLKILQNFLLVPPSFSTKMKIANQPITAAVPVYPVTKKGRNWLLGHFLFGTEIGGYQ